MEPSDRNHAATSELQVRAASKPDAPPPPLHASANRPRSKIAASHSPPRQQRRQIGRGLPSAAAWCKAEFLPDAPTSHCQTRNSRPTLPRGEKSPPEFAHRPVTPPVVRPPYLLLFLLLLLLLLPERD